MTTQSLPVSAIVLAKNIDEPKKKTRQDLRKAKELEEARKHIPQYIAQAPWYYGSDGPTLKHQRSLPVKRKEFSSKLDWYNRGTRSVNATRFRKGACENCGAASHKKKNCSERPRKVGAKFTGEDIAPDEYDQPNLYLDYDGKRDRWNGYNPVVEEYAKVEPVKCQLKAEKLTRELVENNERNEDEDKYADDVDMPGTKVDSKQRITVRNLRIREDTAKYLTNLDPNSAYYDPKSRSMRDNPYKTTGKLAEEVQFAGDNFVRFTGDTQKHATAQLFAWEVFEKGVDVHLLGEPTKLEILNKEFDKRKVDFKNTINESILDKYGGSEHLDMPDKLLQTQSESYTEYSRHGKVLKGLEKAVVRSNYEEDAFVSNHTSVWGSYWKNDHWGYQCCHQFVKNSYCVGESLKNVEECQGDEIKAKVVYNIRVKESTIEEMDERKRPYNGIIEIKEPTTEEMEAYYTKKRRSDDPMEEFLRQ